MDLDFSEEQQMIVDMTRGLLEEYCPVEVVRQVEDDPKGYPDGLWKQVSEAGLTGILIPESFGGGGQTLLEAALVYEEFGRAMAPLPHFASCVMSAGVLLDAGSEAQQTEWLPKIASGDAILTPAWLEPDRGFGEVGVKLEAKSQGDGWVLNGAKRHVAYASSADRLIVLARTAAGVELFLVDPNADGVKLTHQLSQGSENQYRVDLTDVAVGASDRIGGEGEGWEIWSRAMHDGIVLLAAEAIGGADRALEITVAYSKERVQFDKPLGAFQALAPELLRQLERA